jgi:hypothetical protein
VKEVNPMSTPHQHHAEVTKVVPVFAGTRPDWFVAKCDCGWRGQSQDVKRDADEDADEHVRLMAGEA